MPLQITELPREIQTHIFSYNRYADLISVTLTCKALNFTVEPLIWTHTELHDQEWHAPDPYRHGLLSHIDNKSYRYIEPSPEYLQEFGGSEPTRFMRDTFLRDRAHFFIKAVEIARPHILYQVRSICMTIHFTGSYGEVPPDNMWTLFSRFVNLQALDLTVEWPYDGPQTWDTADKTSRRAEESLPPLSVLQDLRLSGYIPRAFARWLLLNSTTLNTLQLAILDRPISGTICDDRENPPPGRRRDQSPEEETEDEDAADLEARVPHDSGSDSESDSYSVTSSTSSFNSEQIAPRALSIVSPTDILHLHHLTALILTRPAESSQPVDDWRDMYTSVRSDTLILHEWAHLIRSSRPTLKHLVLDQRPFCEDIEQDGTGSSEFLELYPYGPGFDRFTEIVLPVLLEERDEDGRDVEWPVLESVTFYGFDVPGKMVTKVHPRVQRRGMGGGKKNGKSFFGKIRERFERMNGDGNAGAESGTGVIVETHLGMRIEFPEDTGVVTRDGLGPGWRPDPDTDESIGG